MHLFYQPEIPQGNLILSQDESRHAVRVLRMKEGDLLEVTDGFGNMYNAKITNDAGTGCEFLITGTTTSVPKKHHIHIAISPTKNIDRTEWFVEKSVELGIDEISFLECKTSERKAFNMERMEKLAISAMKQSRQTWLPKLQPMNKFEHILKTPAAQKFIAYVDNENTDYLSSVVTAASSYIVLIGPEGDFSREELAASLNSGFQKVSLGPHRLRTETAALAACLTLNILNY